MFLLVAKLGDGAPAPTGASALQRVRSASSHLPYGGGIKQDQDFATLEHFTGKFNLFHPTGPFLAPKFFILF